MQNLEPLSLDINSCKKIVASKLFYSSSPNVTQRRPKSLQFVPFLQERDSMGKLLTTRTSATAMSGKRESNCSSIQNQMIQSKIERSCIEDEKIDKVMQSFFKKIDIEAKEANRHRTSNKKIMLLVDKEPKLNKYSTTDYDVSSAIDQIKIRNKGFTIKTQSKNSSPMKKSGENLHNLSDSTNLHESIHLLKLQSINKMQQRSQSMLQKKSKVLNLPVSTSVSPTKRHQQIQQKVRKSQSLMQSLKVKLNPEQPEYKRYKQQQQMSLKVFPDYEQGHEKFKQKMRQSKIISYNIKKQLQLD